MVRDAAWRAPLGRDSRRGSLGLNGDPNGPEEPAQFTTDGGRGLLRALAPPDERSIAVVQAMLRFSRDGFHVFIQRSLPSAPRGTERRPVAIRPRCFDHDPREMRIARFRDPAALRPFSTGVLAGDGAAVSHQLSGFDKA